MVAVSRMFFVPRAGAHSLFQAKKKLTRVILAHPSSLLCRSLVCIYIPFANHACPPFQAKKAAKEAQKERRKTKIKKHVKQQRIKHTSGSKKK